MQKCSRLRSFAVMYGKFAKRWNDYLEQYKESARRIDGEKIQLVFHIFLDKKTNEIVLEIDQWIRQGQGEDGQSFTPETCPRQFYSLE